MEDEWPRESRLEGTRLASAIENARYSNTQRALDEHDARSKDFRQQVLGDREDLSLESARARTPSKQRTESEYPREIDAHENAFNQYCNCFRENRMLSREV